MRDKHMIGSAFVYAKSDQSLCYLLEYSMTVMLLTEHHLEFLSLKGGCTCSSESTLVKMPHCWILHVPVHMYITVVVFYVSVHLRLIWLPEEEYSAEGIMDQSNW